MEEAVRALLRRHAFRPGLGDPARIAGDFAVPLIAYYRDRILVFRTRSEIAASVETYFARLRETGVVEVRPKVLEIAPGGPDRLSALVDWCQVDVDGQVVSVNRARSFFRRVPGRGTPQIELVEYLSIAQRSIFADAVAAAKRVH